jgi:hypothetical protein
MRRARATPPARSRRRRCWRFWTVSLCVRTYEGDSDKLIQRRFIYLRLIIQAIRGPRILRFISSYLSSCCCSLTGVVGRLFCQRAAAPRLARRAKRMASEESAAGKRMSSSRRYWIRLTRSYSRSAQSTGVARQHTIKARPLRRMPEKSPLWISCLYSWTSQRRSQGSQRQM